MQIEYAQPGTISSGTLRTEDLCKAFGNCLMELENSNKAYLETDIELKSLVSNALQHYKDCYDQFTGQFIGNDESIETTYEELPWALDWFAPPGYTFGSHPGDGVDFGFWPKEIMEF